MDYLGLKQLSLIKKVKKYYRLLKLRGIDVSRSSFCYVPSYGLNPGNTKLIQWIEGKIIIFQNIKIIFFHILAISSYFNYELLNSNQKNYKNIFITWGKKYNFKKKIFSDNLLNVDSKKYPNCLFLVIYLDVHKPDHIPKNVVLFLKKKPGRSLFFFIKEFFNTLFKHKFNILKFIHYFSAQTVFAKILNSNLKKVMFKNNINKLILPYEGQPFQNFIVSQLDKKIKTYGIIHSILPALPTNLIKRKGSPHKIFVSGKDQSRILIDNLGWSKNDVKITKSLRLKKKINKNISGSVFLPINLSNSKKIIYDFEKLLKIKNEFKFPFLKVRNHPAMSKSNSHIYLTRMLENLILKYDTKSKYKSKKNICIIIGPTSSVIEYLAKKFYIIHIPINPILDIYNSKIFSNIFTINKKNFYVYKDLNKNNIISFGNNNYNFKNLKIL